MSDPSDKDEYGYYRALKPVAGQSSGDSASCEHRIRQETDEPKFVLMFDIDKKAVGCVLLQAALGCDQHLLHRFGFDTSCWLTSPTPGLRRIAGTEAEWRRAAEIANAAWAGKRAG